MKNYRKIILNDYEVSMGIGIHKEEKESLQRVLISVELYLYSPASEICDKIENVFDYDFIRSIISEIVMSKHFNLQETLVDEIVAACLKENDILAVCARSEKLDAYTDCKSVGFEVFKSKGDL